MTLLFIFLFGAIGISFLCSLLESSLMSTSFSYIIAKEEEGDKNASRIRKYKTEPEKPLAAILSLNTIANTIGAAGVGLQTNEVFGEAWFGVVSGVTTLLILIFSEIIPKTIGSTHWKQLLGFTVRTIRVAITLAMTINLIAVVLSVTGLLTPTTGALVHNAGSCFVVLLAALLYDRKYRPLTQKKAIKKDSPAAASEDRDCDHCGLCGNLHATAPIKNPVTAPATSRGGMKYSTP